MGADARTLHWPEPCLMLITDRSRLRGHPLEETVSQAIDGGVNAVHLREKELDARELYDLAITLRGITRGRALLLINDRLDIAMACGADGVHLPERGLPVEKARAVAAGCLIGRSVHSVESAVAAERAGADYVIAGPVYETSSHPHRPAAGLDLIRDVATAVRVPVLAIGGITAGRVSDVLSAGADGIAVIGAILDPPEARGAAQELNAALESHA